MIKNYFLFYNNFCDLDNEINKLITKNVNHKNKYIARYDGITSILNKEEIIKNQNICLTNRDYFFCLVIDNFETLNKEIINSLLLFLEELPENTLCIFTSSKEHLILKTIISRCEIIYLPYKNDVLVQIINGFDSNISNVYFELLKNNFYSKKDVINFFENDYKEFKELNGYINSMEYKNWNFLLKFFREKNYSSVLNYLSYWLYFWVLNNQYKISNSCQELKNLFTHNTNRTLIFNEFLGMIIEWKQL